MPDPSHLLPPLVPTQAGPATRVREAASGRLLTPMASGPALLLAIAILRKLVIPVLLTARRLPVKVAHLPTLPFPHSTTARRHHPAREE